MSDTPVVSYDTDGHVATIRLKRAKAMNAFDAQMRRELGVAQARAEADENIRVVVLSGSERAFSAGTDLKETLDIKGRIFDNSVSDYKPLIDGVTNSEKIYLASINGVAGGVALGLAMGADLAIMSEEATVFSPFSNIGLVPDGGASWFLLQHLGAKRAFAAIAECTHLDAQTCLDTGIVNKVVPHAQLDDAAASWAAALAQRAPLSLRYAKKLLRANATLSREDAARLESEYQNMCISSDDAKSAIMAFINKKPPVFKGC